MKRYICIHGHFYQPPRENAWLEAVELQDSAHPYHDWNERVTAEGYAPNTASRILDGNRRIIDIINNYSKISFNVGPTLLSWMEKNEPDTYQSILKADKISRRNFSGHGSALAQVYNHMIMPLANRRDKQTQVIWGVQDFRHRYGRDPEGMWLPETAVDLESLEVLAENGIKFTILSPYQAAKIREAGGEEWMDVSGGKIDPKMPYLCNLPSGKSISLFFYDGPVSQEVGFSDLLDNGENFANRLAATFAENGNTSQLVHIATDGETYGHHRHHGDMALAYCLYHIESNNLAKLTVYGEYLEKNPPTHEVQIIENTSWSCIHGIERWRSNCGCNMGTNGEWTQEWRAPLREAMDQAREQLAAVFEKEMAPYCDDPWRARDDYVRVVLDRSVKNVEQFLQEHSKKELSQEEKIRLLRLLELQRNAMLMYTSCGWFFDEISGIETTQVMQYAARAMQLCRELTGNSPEEHFIEVLEEAPSNIPEYKNGADVYRMWVKPSEIDLLRVGAHYAVSSVFTEHPEKTRIYSYQAKADAHERVEAGKIKLAIGRAHIRSDITWNESDVSFIVLHLGGHIINGGVREFMGKEPFMTMAEKVKEIFWKSDVAEIIHLLDENFGTHNYSLWHLFKDEQRKVFEQILESTYREVEVYYRQIYESDYALMQTMQQMRIPFPKALLTPVSFILNKDLHDCLSEEEINLYKLHKLTDEFKKWNIGPDKENISFIASSRIVGLMEKYSRQSDESPELAEKLQKVLELLCGLSIDLNIWKAQNIYFNMKKKKYDALRKKAGQGDKRAKEWIEHFNNIGKILDVKVD